MGEAVERLTRLVEAEDRYDIPFAELRDAQIEAMNERFQERKGEIKLVGHRAREAGISEVRSHEEAVRLLLPHTAYKSYPENWLAQKRWDRLSKWLDTVSTHRVPVDKVSDAEEVDDWIEKLAAEWLFRVLLERHDRQIRHAGRFPEGHGLVQEGGGRRLFLGIGRQARAGPAHIRHGADRARAAQPRHW